MPPLISVVVATYNGERYVEPALESALAQDHEPLEVIVVDDGSTDATPAIVARHDVHLIRRANGGQGAAKNTGIGAARGSLIAFLDHDDLWAPGKLSAQAAALAREPAAAGVVAQLRVRLELGIPRPKWLPRSEVYPWFPPTAWLVRREAFDAVGLFDEESSVPDFDWMLRARDAGLTFAILEEVLGTYRIHARNASYRRDAVSEDGFRALRRSLDRLRSAT